MYAPWSFSRVSSEIPERPFAAGGAFTVTSVLLPDAGGAFASDIAIDQPSNAHFSDRYASAIYKVDVVGTPTVFGQHPLGVEVGFFFAVAGGA